MIVESLNVRNWRGYRQLHRFDFGPGLNLLCGPNEAGKSTLFEVLGRALFDRHTSRAAELRRLQPLGSSLAPELEVVFRCGEQRYRVRKRFLVEPLAELYTERGERFELDHEADRADEELRRLLGGESTRGVSRPEHRGLAQALWLLQRESPVPESSWNEALERGLSGLLELALRSELEERVVAAIDREVRRHWTAGGRISRRSELGRLEQELPALEDELGRGRGEMERAEELRRQLAELERQRSGILEREAEETVRLPDLRREVTEAAELERRLEQARAERATLEERVAALGRSLYTLERRQKRLAEVEQVRGELGQREAQLATDVRQFRRNAETHARRWEKEHQPRLKEVEAKIAEVQGRLRLDQLEREVQLLTEAVERRRRLRIQHDELGLRLRELAAPSDAELTELQRLEREVEMARVRAASGAVRVRFELTGVEVSCDGVEVDPGSGEYLVTGPATFVLGELGSVQVRGAEGAERLGARLAELEAELSIRCQALGGSSEEMAARVERRRQLEGELAGIVERLGDTEERGEGERLDEARRELALLRRRVPQAVLPGIEGWALSRTHDELRDLEEERDRLQKVLDEEREAEQAAQHLCLEKSEELRDVSQRTSALRSEQQSLRSQIGEELEAFGTIEALARAHERERQRLEEVGGRVTELEREHARRVEGPRRELEAVEARLEALEGEKARLSSEITDRVARIEEVAAHGLYSRTSDLEARVEHLRERRELLLRRARGARLLGGVVGELRRRRTQSLSEPIAAIVDRWLEQLTAGRYRRLDLDSDLLPVAVLSERYGEPLPLDSLSHGTHEQVAVLVRLAIGILLSGEERQLVVLDDRLVNADPERMERLCDILREAAQHCQILLATCRPELYLGLEEAHRVEVPGGVGADDLSKAVVAGERDGG